MPALLANCLSLISLLVSVCNNKAHDLFVLDSLFKLERVWGLECF